jgi:uncharacterized protein YkwD
MVVRGFAKVSVSALLAMTCAIGVVPSADASYTLAERKVTVGLANKINAERVARFGIAGLPEWFYMSTEAENHSYYYMGAQRRLSHDGFCDDTNGDSACDLPPGDNIALNTRIERIQDTGDGVGFVCENVAVTVKDTKAKAIKALFKLWDNSPPHNACMFRATTDWMGIGVKKKGTSKWYATLLAAEDSSPANP